MNTTTTNGTNPHDPAPPPSDPFAIARKVLKALASLQLTVVLFAFAIGLVFLGTVAQMDHGIWTVVDKYFWSWVVMVPFDLFHKFGTVFFAEQYPKDTAPWTGAFPFPAGKLLGRIPIPEDTLTNLTFGGPDFKTLFVTAGKTVFRIEVSVSGYTLWPPLV